MPTYSILLLGSGGRESALASKLSESPLTSKLYIAPGNGGTSKYGENVNIKINDFDAIKRFVVSTGIDLVICGSEDPLVGGLREYLEETGVKFVGPGQEGASLEGSKDFAKVFMTRHNIPTALHLTVTKDNIPEGKEFMSTLQPPYVLKADGLAAGKGVLIIPDLSDACAALEEMLDGKFGKASQRVVIEEFLHGIECSVFAVTDGTGKYKILGVAKDYKRIGDGDTGLNTGGMGAVSPVPFADKTFMDKVEKRVVKPTVDGLKSDGIDYRGFIFFGLMCTPEGEPMVIEYNVRMGDPETEVIMPRLCSDLTEMMVEVADGRLSDKPVEMTSRYAVTVMAVSAGYPESYAKGKEITGNLNPTGSEVFHAGTSVDSTGRLITSGGRVLTVTSLADSIADAAKKSYTALKDIYFEGKTSRSDISKDLQNISLPD